MYTFEIDHFTFQQIRNGDKIVIVYLNVNHNARKYLEHKVITSKSDERRDIFNVTIQNVPMYNGEVGVGQLYVSKETKHVYLLIPDLKWRGYPYHIPDQPVPQKVILTNLNE